VGYDERDVLFGAVCFFFCEGGEDGSDLYSVDYPFKSNEQGGRFVREVEKSGMVTDEQLAMIAYQNAEELLKIRVQL
jgi:hypothetical protein